MHPHGFVFVCIYFNQGVVESKGERTSLFNSTSELVVGGVEGLSRGGVFGGCTDNREASGGMRGEEDGALSAFKNFFEKDVVFELLKGGLREGVVGEIGELIVTEFIARMIDGGCIIALIHTEGEFLGIGDQFIDSILDGVQFSEFVHPFLSWLFHFNQLSLSSVKIGLPFPLDGLAI